MTMPCKWGSASHLNNGEKQSSSMLILKGEMIKHTTGVFASGSNCNSFVCKPIQIGQ